MPLSEIDWEAARPEADLITVIDGTLEKSAPEALRVDDFLRNVGRSNEERGLLRAVTSAIRWQFSRERSKAVVEATLERLVHEGRAEKRAVEDREGITIYYRAVGTAD
ncbi:MAG: hypothetical protein IH933_01580 [Euryarchaeota archaeon]|jgi:hypothetical protein|nr:hypothetical protein [Euryarchaeota archaeon]